MSAATGRKARAQSLRDELAVLMALEVAEEPLDAKAIAAEFDGWTELRAVGALSRLKRAVPAEVYGRDGGHRATQAGIQRLRSQGR